MTTMMMMTTCSRAFGRRLYDARNDAWKKEAVRMMRGGAAKKKMMRGGGSMMMKKPVMAKKGKAMRKKVMPSGSTDFDLDVVEIIEEAYERCGQVRTGYDIKTARRSMNLMFADWANRGLNLWTVNKQPVFGRRHSLYTLDQLYGPVGCHSDAVALILSYQECHGVSILAANKTTQNRQSIPHNRQIPRLPLGYSENSTIH